MAFIGLAVVVLACLSVRSCAVETYERNSSTGNGLITTRWDSPHVLRATVNHPPINMLDAYLISDMYDWLSDIKSANTTDNPWKVVIVDSGVDDFYIGRIDVHLFSEISPPDPSINQTDIINKYTAITRMFSQIEHVIFIAEINGRALGPGDEISVQMDMRFVGPGTLLAQFENGNGLFPGAGGVLFLTRLIGRARTFEYVLSAEGVNAKVAAEIGWANKAFETEEDLKGNVSALAKRIATFDKRPLIATKRSINSAGSSQENFDADTEASAELVASAPTQELFAKFINATSSTTNTTVGQFDLGLPDTILELYEK